MPELVPALGPGSVLLASLQTAPACAAGRPAKLHQAHGLEQSGHLQCWHRHQAEVLGLPVCCWKKLALLAASHRGCLSHLYLTRQKASAAETTVAAHHFSTKRVAL